MKKSIEERKAIFERNKKRNGRESLRLEGLDLDSGISRKLYRDALKQLRGSLLDYIEPFSSATDPDDWNSIAQKNEPDQNDA